MDNPEVTLQGPSVPHIIRVVLLVLLVLIGGVVWYSYKNPDNFVVNYLANKFFYDRAAEVTFGYKPYKGQTSANPDIFVCKKDSDCVRYVNKTNVCSDKNSHAGTSAEIKYYSKNGQSLKECPRVMDCARYVSGIRDAFYIPPAYSECEEGTKTEPACVRNKCVLDKV